jgi:hypothetical protein
VDGLDQALARLESGDVKVLQKPQPALNGLFMSAFIQGPDGVELELVETASR